MAATSSLITMPTVTFGRLTGYYWFKLQRKNNLITAFASTDGNTWREIGNTKDTFVKQLYVGLTVASGIQQITTTVKFDHVDFKKD